MRTILALCCLLLLSSYSGCFKDRFREDPANAGLSVFSGQRYNVMSFYVNEVPWVRHFDSRGGPDMGTIDLVETSASRDSLYLSWTGGTAGGSDEQLVIGIPVKKNFTLADLMAFRGRRFPDDSTGISISLGVGNRWDPFSTRPVAGAGRIYFTGIEPDQPGSVNFLMYGLFDGTIGTDTVISKGRFDGHFFGGGNHNLR